jgi:hypothetical protein
VVGDSLVDPRFPQSTTSFARISPEMSPWLTRILNFVSGGPEASTAETLLRGALVGCSLFAMIQLLTMVGTRWGNRNAMSKAFFLSVLIHLCFGLGGAVLEENHRLATLAGAQASAEEGPQIRIREVRVGESTALPAGEENAPAWQRAISVPRAAFSRRQNSTTQAPALPTVPEHAPQADIPFEIPRVAVSEPQPRAPERKESAPSPSRPAGESPPVQTAEPMVDRRPSSTSDPARQRVERTPQPLGASTVERPPVRPADESPVDLARVASTAAIEGTNLKSRPRPESGVPETAGIGAPSPQNAGKSNPRQAGPPVEKAPELPVVRGIVRGIITDSVTGLPLPGATIRFDQAQGEPLTATTREDGTYELRVAASAENSAITATQNGYLPESHNMRSADLRRKGARLDFVLRPANESVIAVEQDPIVHHLGNDRFEGVINSQFQRKSEGTSYVSEFRMSRSQARSKKTRAVITLMVRGVQCQPDIRINGTLLTKRSEKSPADGSFGPLAVPFDPALLREGENEIRVDSVNCNGDLDDFEFVNLQIRLSRPE